MSIEVSNLRITKLRVYLMDIITELIGQYGEMNINFLSDEPNNYSLDKIPVNPTTEQWIIGNFLKRDVYSFRSRMNYSADTMTNIENIGFYETFEKNCEEGNDFIYLAFFNIYSVILSLSKYIFFISKSSISSIIE